jgi:uncharacterized integral membrane protein
MKLVKLIISLAIIGLIGLFVGQNFKAWTAPVSFNLDLWILGKTEWSLDLYVIILISAAMGLLVGVLLMFKPYFRTRKTLARERKERKEAAQGEVIQVTDNKAQASQA